jgi:hypothetical protein
MSSNSKLRSLDTESSKTPALSDETALFLIRDSVAKRRALIYGRLDGEKDGEHCALGAFWADNPKASLNTALIDEVAAVNDSVPRTATPHQRWKKVNEWLRFKISVMMAGKKR